MILDIISFAILMGVIITLLISFLNQRSKRIEYSTLYLQSEIEKVLISGTLQKLLEENDTRTIEETDGFLKFVSESRDWAFTYIENVQESLDIFDKKLVKIIDYYSTYGSTIDGIHVELIKQVSEAYGELKMLLPKEDK